MTRVLDLRAAAERDIEDACLDTERFSPAGARRFLEAVAATCERLRAFPLLGSPFPFRSPLLRDVRRWTISDYPDTLIFYTVTQGAVIVLRVLRASRDTALLFAGGDEDDGI